MPLALPLRAAPSDRGSESEPGSPRRGGSTLPVATEFGSGPGPAGRGSLSGVRFKVQVESRGQRPLRVGPPAGRRSLTRSLLPAWASGSLSPSATATGASGMMQFQWRQPAGEVPLSIRRRRGRGMTRYVNCRVPVTGHSVPAAAEIKLEQVET